MESLDRVGGNGYAQFVGDGDPPVDLENSPYQPFTQGLMAYVDAVQSIRETRRIMDGKQWDLKWLIALMTILKGAFRCFDFFETTLLIAQISAVLTYPHSPDYRPNIYTCSGQTLSPLLRSLIDIHF